MPSSRTAPAASARPPRGVLPAVVLGQLAVTSLWFAPNAVMDALRGYWDGGGVGLVTAAVQVGFIAGTLAFALLGVADRFPANRVFAIAALAGALANVLVIPAVGSLPAVLGLRFATGVCLAGVYPVGMRIASGWYRGGLGRALGFLVGALVLGTASSHLLRAFAPASDWRLVLASSSGVALLGGMLVAFVPEGPYIARTGGLRFGAVLEAFRRPGFRAAALGYFGHMWELYGLWAFIPGWLAARGIHGPGLSLAAFGVIAAGAVGCVAGGLAAGRLGSGRIALTMLAVSGACCVLSPLAFAAPTPVTITVALLWGLAAAGDSPQLSALNALSAPSELVGSALTLTNSIGYAITVMSLLLLEWLQHVVTPPMLLVALAPGPALGIWAARRYWQPPG